MSEPDDDGPATEAELEAARQRHDAERPELAGTELFSRRAVGPDGQFGDVPIGAGDPSDLEGQQVTAKRLGWDDGGDADDDPDRTSYAEMEYDSPDLEGELVALHFNLPDGSAGVAWEVGGQPADPKTVRAKKA